MPRESIHLTPKDVIRFEAKFTKTDRCWNWTGYSNKQGYGGFWLQGKMEFVHRVAHVLYIGIIPTGLCVLHRCDNPRCVNLAHLWLGTHADNDMDREIKGRTAYGERIAGAKLTARNVRRIRALAGQFGQTQKSLAHHFGVTRRNINYIVNARTWVQSAAHQQLRLPI